MNDDIERRIRDCFNSFIREIGPGQFTYWLWSEWLRDNESGLVEDILVIVLKQVLEKHPQEMSGEVE